MTASTLGFHRLLVSAEVSDRGYARSLIDRFTRAGLPVEVTGATEVESHPWSAAAATLIATARPSAGWVAKAEHGALAVRRGEHYVHPLIGCRSRCTYCYLQAHPLGRSPLRLHLAVEELVAAIERLVRDTDSAVPPLFCTGELADSLADAALFPAARLLAGRFAHGDLGFLELRTKSDRVRSLLDVAHNRRTTVAFSVAPQPHIARYEPSTASLAGRLAAAAEVARAGYPVALKFEPLILDPGWEDAYARCLRRVARALPPETVDHVSVGCLRWGAGLAAHPTFARNHGGQVVAGTRVEYRPGRFNGTAARAHRVAAYRLLLGLMRDAGITAPIWWSLEERDVIEELNAAEGRTRP